MVFIERIIEILYDRPPMKPSKTTAPPSLDALIARDLLGQARDHVEQLRHDLAMTALRPLFYYDHARALLPAERKEAYALLKSSIQATNGPHAWQKTVEAQQEDSRRIYRQLTDTAELDRNTLHRLN
jgi:hypothetical protein